MHWRVPRGNTGPTPRSPTRSPSRGGPGGASGDGDGAAHHRLPLSAPERGALPGRGPGVLPLPLLRSCLLWLRRPDLDGHWPQKRLVPVLSPLHRGRRRGRGRGRGRRRGRLGGGFSRRMITPPMCGQQRLVAAHLAAQVTLQPRHMHPPVAAQQRLGAETGRAAGTLERPLARVEPLVVPQRLARGQLLVADVA